MREPASFSSQWLAWRGIIATKTVGAATIAGRKQRTSNDESRSYGCTRQWPQARSEMTQRRSLLDQFESTDFRAAPPNIENHFDGVVNMALRVDTPRNRQTHQIHFRVVAEHQRANFYRANSALNVKFARQRDAGELREGYKSV